MIFVLVFGLGAFFGALALGLVQMNRAAVQDAEMRAREFSDTSVTILHK
jgi:hypothetical protein